MRSLKLIFSFMVPTPTTLEYFHLNHSAHVMPLVKRTMIHRNDHNCADPAPIAPSLSDIRLPSPPSITSILNSRAMSNLQTTRLIFTYERHISELRACTETQIRNIISVLRDGKHPSHVIRDNVSRCIAIYEKHLDHWYQLFIVQLDKSDIIVEPAKFDPVRPLFCLISYCYIHIF